MPPENRFRHQQYRLAPPTAPYLLLGKPEPVSPQSPQFRATLAQAGQRFAQAGVTHVLCIHGTFAGNDTLGLLTELQRYAPGLSERLRRMNKSAFDSVVGETGNYTAEYAATFQEGLNAGADRPIHVERFNWSSLNNHIGRADGAVRLINHLAQLSQQETPDSLRPRQRVLLWAHSHGGNVCTVATNLLAADDETRHLFFRTARHFYQPWVRRQADMPVWQHVEGILADDRHPLRRLAVDIVTFGTPIRYGWDSGGYDRLLHFTQHRPAPGVPEYLTQRALRLDQLARGTFGDSIQQIGIAGTNFPPIPLALRSFLADWRLGKLLQQNVDPARLILRLARRARVADEGKTLLVDYGQWGWNFVRYLAGHAVYTRRPWLPFHVAEVARHFYGSGEP